MYYIWNIAIYILYICIYTYIYIIYIYILYIYYIYIYIYIIRNADIKKTQKYYFLNGMKYIKGSLVKTSGKISREN